MASPTTFTPAATTSGPGSSPPPDRRLRDAPPEPYSRDQAMAVIDEVMRFLRGGLEALRNP
jgi:hypothetical protein